MGGRRRRIGLGRPPDQFDRLLRPALARAQDAEVVQCQRMVRLHPEGPFVEPRSPVHLTPAVARERRLQDLVDVVGGVVERLGGQRHGGPCVERIRSNLVSADFG